MSYEELYIKGNNHERFNGNRKNRTVSQIFDYSANTVTVCVIIKTFALCKF